MSWFRTNIGAIARLALFALTVEFVLSFGHVHSVAPQISPSSVAAALSDGPTLAASDRQLTAERGLAKQDPAKPDHHRHPGDACAICTVMAIAHAMLLSPPPALVLPQAVAFHLDLPTADRVQPTTIAAAFQARAPPLS